VNIRSLRRAFVAASCTWAAALPIAAWTAARSHQPAWTALSLAVYAVGAMVCHQLPARSFHVWGAQLPVCARCTGIYVAAAVVAACSRLFPRAEGGAARAVLVAAAAPTAATLLFEWTTGEMPSNAIRALAGAPIGAAVAWVIAGL